MLPMRGRPWREGASRIDSEKGWFSTLAIAVPGSQATGRGEASPRWRQSAQTSTDVGPPTIASRARSVTPNCAL
jgi:hypothetical protein